MYTDKKKSKSKRRYINRLTDDPSIYGVAKRKQNERALSSRNLAKVRREKRLALLMGQSEMKQPKLTGLQIRAIRLTASRSTFPSNKRIKMWVVAQKK